MMRRLTTVGTTVALSLSFALVACGTDSPNPGPSPDAKTFDAAPATIDAGAATIDAAPATPDAGPALADGGPSGTVAIHSLAVLNPETGDVVANSTRIGQINISFTENPQPVDSVNIKNGIAPCSASSFNIADPSRNFDAGDLTFTVTHDGGAAGPTIPVCSFDTDTMAYKCGSGPIGDVIVDGDSVLVNYAGAGQFAGYNKSLNAGLNPTLTAATKTLLSAPLDVSGDVDLSFAMNETVSQATGIAFVVVLDVSNGTMFSTTDPTDIIGTDATKTANLTCSAAFMNTMTIPQRMIKVLGDLHPKKVRISLFHDQSDLGLLSTNTNIVVGQGYIEFTAVATTAAKK